MEFEDALRALKAGNIVTNENWNGNEMYLVMQVPDTNSKMQLPYIFMSNAQKKFVPWTPSQMDLFSDGWINTGPI